jgi:hypothetical protein
MLSLQFAMEGQERNQSTAKTKNYISPRFLGKA